MILNSAPVLATSLKALIRSALFTLGIDDVLIDFLANTAIRAAVLLTLLSVEARIHHCREADSPMEGSAL